MVDRSLAWTRDCWIADDAKASSCSRTYPPLCADVGSMPIMALAVQIWVFCVSTSQHSSRRRNVLADSSTADRSMPRRWLGSRSRCTQRLCCHPRGRPSRPDSPQRRLGPLAPTTGRPTTSTGPPSYRHNRDTGVTRYADGGISRTGWAGGWIPCSYFKMLIARAITSAPMPRDTTASIIISSLAHRLTAETSVGLNAVAVQKASDR